MRRERTPTLRSTVIGAPFRRAGGHAACEVDHPEVRRLQRRIDTLDDQPAVVT